MESTQTVGHGSLIEWEQLGVHANSLTWFADGMRAVGSSRISGTVLADGMRAVGSPRN